MAENQTQEAKDLIAQWLTLIMYFSFDAKNEQMLNSLQAFVKEFHSGLTEEQKKQYLTSLGELFKLKNVQIFSDSTDPLTTAQLEEALPDLLDLVAPKE
ncbi:MAG: hypothetical protein WC775_05530 [Patescibacteria group bacterium]|jgi:hypothetical protein